MDDDNDDENEMISRFEGLHITVTINTIGITIYYYYILLLLLLAKRLE